MGKTVVYVAGAAVFLGIGALITGLIIWYHHPDIRRQQALEESRYAQCNLQSTGIGGDVSGTLFFEQARSISPVRISGDIIGLATGPHGFHVHQWGMQVNKCTDAGGHYNPFGKSHSAPNSTDRHVGDLGNVVTVDNDAKTGTITTVAITDNILTLFGHYSIAGRAIVIHEGEDDLGRGGDDGSLKTGNAGGRVACCVVYFTKAPAQ